MTGHLGPSAAWVESPLQLLGAIEAHAAGLLGPDTLVQPRRDVAGMPSAVGVARGLHLPPGLTLALPDGPVPPSTVPRRGWAAGDIYSGQVQRELLRHRATRSSRRARNIVLLDDGLATMRVAAQLIAPAPTPLVRDRSRASGGGARSALQAPPRVLLGYATREHLLRLAGRGELVLFTALPPSADVRRRLEALGARVVTHRFPWLGSQPVTERPLTRTVVVGSALAADGLVDAGAYQRWVEHLAEHDRLSYFPHRRERPDMLAALAANDAIRVEVSTLPIEMRLRHLTPGQRVVCLPSTALATLRLVLPDGVSLEGVPVPTAWWTSAASPRLRARLAGVLDSAAPASAPARASVPASAPDGVLA